MLEILLGYLHLDNEHSLQYVLFHLQHSFQLLVDIADIQNQSLLHFKISHMMYMSLYQIETTGLHRRLWMMINKLKMVIIPIPLIV
ncbi:hypothetical protein ACOSP7_003618 [Xanthoceras sorbifolium]